MSAEARNSDVHWSQLEWNQAVSPYARPDRKQAVWQLLNTFVPYVALWALMVHLINNGRSFLLVAPLLVLAAGFLIRIFIFFHDCVHGSFFVSRRANRIIGFCAGLLTFTPFDDWRHSHLMHHATSSDLDRRGHGDVWLMTVDEYRTAPRARRMIYRGYRSPWTMFVLGPFFNFLIFQRCPVNPAGNKQRNSVLLVDLAVAAIIGIAALTIGVRTYLVIQIPIMMIAGAAGIWLFYVQHQFERTYWARHKEWDRLKSALYGASYYRLPKLLQWFTGNIGLHHVHHLNPGIPNYRLQACYDSIPAFTSIPPLTPLESLRCLRVNLWDEKNRKTASFGEITERKRAPD